MESSCSPTVQTGGETGKCNLEGITNLTMSSNIVQVMKNGCAAYIGWRNIG